MATRGTVFTFHDGSYVGIYNHFDSYPEDLGKTLKENYDNINIVKRLIFNGDSSYICETIEDSKFYADSGEPVSVSRADSIKEFVSLHGEDYNYFFNPETNKWEIY